MILKPEKLSVSAISHVGCIRKNNEDNFYLDGYILGEDKENFESKEAQYDIGKYVFAVCDGMGGENAGERASYLAVTELKKYMEHVINKMRVFSNILNINEYVQIANNLIYEMSLNRESIGMGTTFSALCFDNEKAYPLNLGDSRIYLLRDKKLFKLTNDHTKAYKLVKLGVLTEAEARKHKSKNILTRHLGVSPEEGIMEAEFYGSINIKCDDIFLISSDGLTDMVEDSKIEEVLSMNLSSSELTKILLNEALEKGGRDNITIITIKVI